MSFSFIQNPTGDSLTGADLVTSALDQPMSLGSTFWDQAKGGVLESFGLGTAIRSFSTPEAAPPKPEGPVSEALSTVNRAIDPATLLRRAIGSDYDGDATLSEDQYKQSPSYRENIPWSAGLTTERAAALADQDDRRKVREFYAAKRPITSFFGNLGGQAIDPINYIPVAGEAVAAANVSRFGRVAGRSITGALDAAGNTAAAALVTAPTRAQFGDDISFHSTISQIAMAAVIGGAFGAVAGKFGRETPPELRAHAEEKLATLQNVQEARVALNDALDGMIHRGEVSVSPVTADAVARVADVELPKVAIERLAREADPVSFDRLDTLDRTFDINETEIRRLQAQTMDNEQYGPIRAAMIQADQLAERVKKADEAVGKSASEKQRAINVQRATDARQALKDHLATIDDQKVQELERIDDTLALRRQAHEPVVRKRSQLASRAQQLRDEARAKYWAERPARVVLQDPKPTVEASPAIAAPEVAAAEAAQRVARPEATRDVAEQFRVDPETGAFPEQADIEQLIAEGRVTDEDRALLDEADATMKSANAYGEAVKSFANCVI